jgi:hypothetical protein
LAVWPYLQDQHAAKLGKACLLINARAMLWICLRAFKSSRDTAKSLKPTMRASTTTSYQQQQQLDHNQKAEYNKHQQLIMTKLILHWTAATAFQSLWKSEELRSKLASSSNVEASALQPGQVQPRLRTSVHPS